MAKSQITFNKKENEKKRLKKRLDKQQKKEERKSNQTGNGTESMFAYVDEHGNITDTPPDRTMKKKVDASTIELGAQKKEKIYTVRTGRVEFFNDSKGYGFIKETDTDIKYFVHANSLTETIKENDLVSFDAERSQKGMNAVNVSKI